MEFLEDNQIEEWIVDRAIPRSQDLPSSVLVRCAFGQAVEPRGQEAEVAREITHALGEWDECLLWVKLWGVWGSSEDWPKYYSARGAQGEHRSIEKAPGHLFGRSERSEFLHFLQLILENAWDAEVLPAFEGRSNAKRGFVSHDEFAEVVSVHGRFA